MLLFALCFKLLAINDYKTSYTIKEKPEKKTKNKTKKAK